MPPKCVVAVAQIAVLAAEEQAHYHNKHPVTETAEQFHIRCAATLQKTRPFGEVSTRQKHPHKRGDFFRIGRAITIQHHNDIASSRFKTGTERHAFAPAGFHDDFDIRAELTCNFNRVIRRPPINQNDFSHHFR